MARPTKPKDVKPEEAGAAPAPASSGDSVLDIKFILTILLISVVSLAGSAASVFFLSPMVMGPIIGEQVKMAMAEGAEAGEHGEEEEHHEGGGHETSMNLELDEFTVNLKTDPSLGGNQYLRTKMSLSIAVPEEEFCDPTGGHHANNDINEASQAVRMALVPTIPGRFISAQQFEQGTIAGAAVSITSDSTERLIASGGGPDPFTLCMNTFNQNMARYVPSLRDVINQALMKRTAGTLASIEGQEILKDEIITESNHLLGGHYKIARVNFSDFIIQY